MATYDCRRDREPGSIGFPCSVKIVDPSTGQRIANVFYAQTSPAKIGRFIVDADGNPMANAASRRKVVNVDGRGKQTVEVVYDRLETFEFRPWKAIALDTGEVVAKSEGCL